MPVDVIGLGVGKQRYGLLLNDEGGIMDDLMFVNTGDDLFVIVNGACKAADIAHIQNRIGQRCRVELMPDWALLALQGAQSGRCAGAPGTGRGETGLHDGRCVRLKGVPLYATRSGYSGEDGFEISILTGITPKPCSRPVGATRGETRRPGCAQRSRLEAGLCLYGNDIDTTTTPVEAALNWAMQKVRRTGGERAGGAFPAQPRCWSNWTAASL